MTGRDEPAREPGTRPADEAAQRAVDVQPEIAFLGHVRDRVERIEQMAGDIPGLDLAGNAYRGVGIPFCVRSGEEAAGRVLESDSLATPNG